MNEAEEKKAINEKGFKRGAEGRKRVCQGSCCTRREKNLG